MSQITSEQRKAAKDINTPEAELKSLAELDTELARLVSRNDSATDALLQHLGSHSDATVRKWVATHPATPVNVLLKLGQQFPEQLLQNPILDFLFLENPALLNEFPIGTVRAALKRKSAPRAILEHGLNLEDESAHLALAQNPAAPEELIDTLLQKTPHESVKEAIEARRQTEPSIEAANEMFFEALCERMAEYGDKKAEMKIFEALLEVADIHAECITRLLDAKSKNQFHEDLEALTEEQNPLVLRALAKRTDLSIKAMLAMLPKLTEASLKDIARNAKMHPDVLVLLLRDASSEVRSLSACNKNLPIEALDKAAHHLLIDNVQVMKRLAESHYIPALILLNRDSLAKNPATSSDVFAQLVADKYESVRENVAENPNTPSDILAQLSMDKDEWVRRNVAGNTNTPPRTLAQLANDSMARGIVAENPNSSSDILAQLSVDKAEWVRERVARNPSAPSDILVQLATDRHELVRKGVAQNLNTPADILTNLALDKNVWVRLGVANNPNAPSDILADFATDQNVNLRNDVAANPSTPSDVLSQLALDRCEEIRYSVAKNLNTSSDVLARFALDKKEWWVRWAVTQNPNTPPDALAELANMNYSDVQIGISKNGASSTKDEASSNGIDSQLVTDKEELCSRYYRSCVGYSNKDTMVNKLVNMKHRDVRISIAENPNTPSITLIQLAEDEDKQVRKNVAEHPNTPSDVLSQLNTNKDNTVREHANRHSYHPPQLLEDLLSGKMAIKSGMLGACIQSAHFYTAIEPYMPEVLARLKGESEINA